MPEIATSIPLYAMLLSYLRKRAVLSAAAPRQPRLLLSQSIRFKRYEAYDTRLDQDALAEARLWYSSFDASQLPKGSTTYARSSGPGGQHVNKYEDSRPCFYFSGEATIANIKQ